MPILNWGLREGQCAKGVLFSMASKKQDFGGVLAQFVDSEGAHCSVGAEAA
jgi:hypothetical protein